MARRGAKDEGEERPVTAEERAESVAIARRHISACRLALIAAGAGRKPPRRRHCKDERPAEDAGDGAPGPADDERALAAIAQGLTRNCRRGDCRRSFTCRFGARRGESTAVAPPCLKRLPKDAVMALRLGAMRLRSPEAFRDPQLFKFEQSEIRRRAAEVRDMAAEKSGLS
ncbi:hypothetical protein [Jiella avicenniae]|uniref:Uncharacterized protein n=1 Tax=Jiella avicenniae TaxID=2907202 RepID=A0A9X1P5E5_9HYPH|nr:hypothetical protein [Jiella avicenniae]MCE7030119.1 hypothetical protein [Jiella avicenniae]